MGTVVRRIVMQKLEFPKDFLNKIICGDAIDVMKHIPNGAVNLVITSPHTT